MCVWPAATSATQAYADDAGAKSINIGTSCITVPENGWNATDGNYLLYGEFGYPVKYRILTNADEKMLIDSDEILWEGKFRAKYTLDDAQKYAASEIRA